MRMRQTRNGRTGTLFGIFVAASLSAALSQAADSGLVSAARDGDLDYLESLLAAGAEVDQRQADGSTALIWAVYEGNLEAVQMLLSHGADPNAVNEFGISPVLQAARYGDAAIMRTLLDAGANPATESPNGETLLMAAARTGRVAAIELMLAHGADVNEVDDLWHQSPLMWAAVEGHVEAAGVLLEAGADPDLKAREHEITRRTTRTDFPSGGFTALMFAARDGNEAMSRRLIEGGADIRLTNADGASAMLIAVVNDHFDYAATLLELGADPDDGSLYQAVLMRDATHDWLAKDGTQWRADHPNERTALDLVRLYLDAGADPNKPFVGQLHSTSMCCDTKENGSPMYRAAVAADVAALELLLDHGGSLDWLPQAEEGAAGPGPRTPPRTPLMAAMYGGRGVGMAGGPGDIREGRLPPFRELANREPLDAVQLLLARGADPDAVNSNGEAAIHMAAKDGKLEIVRALAAAGATLDLANGDGKTALDIVDAMPPREPPPTTGAQAGFPQGAQPAEVAEVLRELMGAQE